MSALISLFSKYLDSEKKNELALKLSESLEEDPENVLALCELINELDSSSVLLIYPNILSYSTGLLNNPVELTDSHYNNLSKMVGKLPKLFDDLTKHIQDVLLKYLMYHQNNFVFDVTKILKDIQIENKDERDEVDTTTILSLLNILDRLFMSTEVPNNLLDYILLCYIGSTDEAISDTVSKLLRWRTRNIIKITTNSSTIWDIIFSLTVTKIKFHKSHAYILWLRYLSSLNAKECTTYQNLIKESQYWSTLQNGLISSSHEQRKLCLSILQLSIESVNCSFENKVASWDILRNDLYLREWSRFITLFEILAIDTSLHQATAGSTDIIGLISLDSLIHPSWGLCLLSTGFKATMDSVRKFSLNLLLSIPPKNLHLIKYGLKLLEEVFLPYSMIASHYSVRLVEDKNTCEYGSRISSFIANILSNIHNDDDLDAVLVSILKVMVNLKESFDPSRIYILMGILDGLCSRKVLKFGVHDELIAKLFINTTEGEIYEITTQTINLKFLLHFKFTTLNEYLSILRKFVISNGLNLIVENSSNLQDYLKSNGITQEILLNALSCEPNDDNKLIIVTLLNYDERLVSIVTSQPDLTFSKILRVENNIKLFHDQTIISNLERIISNVINGDEQSELISNLSSIHFNFIETKKVDIHGFWKQLENDSQSDQYYCLSLLPFKFRLFNKLLSKQPEDLSLDSVFKFSEVMLNNSHEVTKSVKNFYKLREDIYSEYFKTVSILSSRDLINAENDVSETLKILTPSLIHYEGNCYVVEIISKFISMKLSLSLTEQIINLLADLWENLASSRLQLNQKFLHVKIIEAMLHPHVISYSVNSKSLKDHLTLFCESVINNSPGRRCLLPTLTKCLSNFQIIKDSSFESLTWVPEVLVKAFVLFQLRSNVFKLENIIGELYDSSLSNLSSSNIYREVYGEEEISSKINLMAILNSIKMEEFALKILQYIIMNEEKYNFIHVIRNTDGLEEWTRIQIGTIIVSLLRVIKKVAFKPFLKTFIDLLETEPSPLVRVYWEWVIILNMDVELKDQLFDSLISQGCNLKPSVVTSYERVLFILIQQLPPDERSINLAKLLTIIIPGATSNKATTRHFSLSLACSIFNEVTSNKLTFDSELLNLVRNINSAATSSESYGQYRSGDALLWNAINDLTLVSISGGILFRLSDREDFDFISKEEYLRFLTEEQKKNLMIPIGENMHELWIKERKVIKTKSSVTSSTASPLQTKSGAWSAVLDNADGRRSNEVVRSDLIVVSSLVDKPPNLGGICRLCDVLGAGLLTLHDLKVKDQQQFKNVAVTADHWMPMIEVKPENIKDFLLLKKKEGYTLIGLEQTDKSVELNNEFNFPQKSLILLGAEKEGIRGDLLAELDVCVEIKQVGIIRSMNIQTATAIIVHAYSTQHC